MVERSLASIVALLALAVQPAAAQAIRPDQAAFRDLYKELVETNTSLSVGSCTLAAQRMAARLTAAGYPEADLHLFTVPDHPKEGGLVAILHAAGAPKQRPILLLAHLDVVEAKREDWIRDPFTLIEEGGYFYARGARDDKSHAAIWVDSLIRLRQEGFNPSRDIKMALTCGEETSTAFNGADYLVKQQRPWVDAAFVMNEGGRGDLDEQGKRTIIELQIGEKVYQDFQLEVTSPGGHSSQPYKPNAIYQLAAALTRIGDHEFPLQLTPVTRAYFSQLAGAVGPDERAAMQALLANPSDSAADAIVSRNKARHSMLHTTCVATMVEAGHAVNALPQRARANINCRILPGTAVDAVQAELTRIIADPAVKITTSGEISPVSPPTALDPAVVGPATKLAAEMFPGIPVVPTMSTGASDSRYFTAQGIPAFGIDTEFIDPDDSNIHGLNERLRVQSLYDGRDFLYRLIKTYAGG